MLFGQKLRKIGQSYGNLAKMEEIDQNCENYSKKLVKLDQNL